MEPFLERFARAWRRLEPDPGVRLGVALSGGLDSAALLAGLRALEPARRIRAIHIDHGLQPESADWHAVCERAALDAGAELVVRHVYVDTNSASGIEAAAREARYAAFAAVLGPGEPLLTAHQADDQLETMLMRLFRGTGTGGLAGVRESTTIGSVRVLRPLLEFTRDELEAWARSRGLEWIADPSNVDERFDRNYIRHRLVPEIRSRWPGAPVTAQRTARQMAAAEHVLADAARSDLGLDTQRLGEEPRARGDAEVGPTRPPVGVDRLLALAPAHRDNALRYLIREAGLPLPTAAQLESLTQALHVGRRDAKTRVAWPGAEARIHCGRLYLFAPLKCAEGAATRLEFGQPWRGACGRLELVAAAADEPGLPESWLAAGLDVRFRLGGERIRPFADAHTRELKKLFQDAGIVPWMRERIPLLYMADALVAVGDLWLTDDVREAAADERRWRVEWTEHPPIR